MHVIPVAIISAYLVCLFLATWWARRLTARSGGGFVGYLLAGRHLPGWVSAALLAGLAVGGVSTIGTAEWAFDRGLSAGWYNTAWAAGAFVMGLGPARAYRRLGVATLPELFERHYSTLGRVLGVVGQLVVQLVVTSLQYVAGAVILTRLAPGFFDYQTGMLVTAVVFVGITLIGGFWAAGLTNVVNVIVIYVGILIGAGLSVGEVGGLGALASRLPASHPGFDLWAMGPGLIAGWFVVMITQVHSTQSVIQIGFAARDERAAARGYLLGGLLILPVGFVSALVGMSAAVLKPGIPAAEALPAMVLDLDPVAAGVVLSGLWAADVSTASALLMGSATLVCTDVIKRFVRPDLSAASEQRTCRATVLALSVATYLLALTVSGILQVLLVGLSVSTAYTVLTVAILVCPRLCRRSSASWTLGATLAALAAWLVAPPSWRVLPHPIYFTWIVSLATFLVVAVLDPRRIEPPRPAGG